MKKKHSIFLFCMSGFLLIAVFVILFQRFHSHNNTFPNLESGNSDTAKARIFYRKAEKMKTSKLDSAFYFYDKAIQLTVSLPRDSAVSHMLTSFYLGLGYVRLNQGNYPEASKYDSIALDIANKAKDKYAISQATNNIGLIYFGQGELDKAMDHYIKALVIAREIDSKLLQAKYFTNMAVVQEYQGKVKESILNFNKTISVAKELHDSVLLAGSLMNVGVVFYDHGQYSQAMEQYKMALQVYQKINGKDGILLCNQNLGDIYFDMGNYARAIELYNLSLQLSVEMGDKENTAKAYQNLGEVFAKIGDYENAMTEYINSARLKEAMGAKQGLATTYSALGSLHYQNKNYKKASYYFQLALKLYQGMNYVQGVATSYLNIANLYSAQNRTNDAINYYLKAKKLDESIDQKSGLADVLINLGSQFQQIKNFTEAEKYYRQAFRLYQTLASKGGIANSYYELADMYNDMAYQQTSNKATLYQTAVDYGLKAYKAGKEIKALPVINNASHVLKQAYSGLGNHAKAGDYADIYIATNDSIFNKSTIEAQTFAEARWNSEKSQRQIEALESQKRLSQEIMSRQKAESQKQSVIIYATVFILLLTVIAAILAISFIRKRRDILNQKQLLNIANLRMQNTKNRMSPHFFFNALSSLSGKDNNVDSIREKLSTISFLLRKSLENIEMACIPLSEEMDIVKAYISLQKERVPGQFDVHFNIDEGVDMSQSIPAMMIQIPVENAIKHGLLPLEKLNKKLIIHISCHETGYRINIEDNGIGLAAANGHSMGTGTGLKVLMQTIHLLNAKNKNKINFSIEEIAPKEISVSGTVVKIFIPVFYSFDLN